MIRIEPESEADAGEVEALFDLAFAPGRSALSSYRLRDGVLPVGDLCLVLRDEYGGLAGAIRHWPVRVGAERNPALLLGPVAVHPTRQGEGLGALLVGEGLDRAGAAGWELVILIGDAPYYRRFGFARATHLRFPPPTNPERILARDLVEGAAARMRGTVRRW